MCIRDRPWLGVLTTDRGLVAGAIGFRRDGAAGASSGGSSGIGITETMLSLRDDCIEVGAARCVLVVEKDCFFQHLLQGRLLAALPLILVTGRGYPDVLTRRLLQRLHRIAPGLPQAYLGDYDPHGVNIFLVYRASCPSLHWLGMHAVDLAGLPERAAQPLTKRDQALLASLLQRPEVRDNGAYVAQLQSMEQKFELEALHAAHGPDALARRFVPEKILQRAWL
eukprot:NODE_12195_length_1239_cov_7.449640.p1 GENE.NODE_12195_length_1239_cov_7.449640~~NODE_12195_length_1239_cov_7.449640.p1  ORF type:complete len:234 (-),score=61.53 NODE_12195_length_1239_cov_7.449640:536-1207(-)